MIEGKNIYLRVMELEDMDCYREMINTPAVSDKVVGWGFPVSTESQIEWYHKAIHDEKNKRFTIVDKESNMPVGMVTLSGIDWHNRSATHGIKLHPSCPKCKGIGTDAVMTLMKYAFEEVNLNRLDSSHIEGNIPSEKLYLKCGWNIEGMKKNAIYRNGCYHNLKITGITKEDYYKAKEKLGW
jgi:RimJ/RimL family protein N-acetyltransferase